MNALKREALRYLGYKGQALSSELERLIDICVKECTSAARPRSAYGVFPVEPAPDGIRLGSTRVVLKGEDLRRHIGGAQMCAVFAVTLGAGIDALIGGAEKTDMTRAVILDACASALVEAACDELNEQIRAFALERGYALTSRYSPGYGDFSLDVQPEIVRLMNAERALGLTCSRANILIPRKSVTAVAGWVRPGELRGPASPCPDSHCTRCALTTCVYRKHKKDVTQ